MGELQRSFLKIIFNKKLNIFIYHLSIDPGILYFKSKPTIMACSRQAFIISVSIALNLLFFCSSCKKVSTNEIVPGDTTKNTTQDLSTKVTTSVSGFVTTEYGNAVNDAAVTMNGSSTFTDKYGFFEMKNVQVIKEAAFITVVKQGYFKGIKTYVAQEGKTAFFRVQLIPATTAGTIDAMSGGNIALLTGLDIGLPANGVINAATSAAYSGQVTIAAQWINPEDNDINRKMPGDLRGVDSAGKVKLLNTYGMAAIEMRGTNGELLQLAAGKKATLTIPMSAGIAATAPSTIPLWYFDETNGLWKQQGFATKSGDHYTGEVSHFSFWNCDGPTDFVHFNCRVTDPLGRSVPNVWVKVSVVSNPINAGWGLTDSSGYASGLIPNNSRLLLEVFGSQDCNIAALSKNFTSGSTDVSIGDLAYTTQQNATITGTVINCSAKAITDGYIIMKKNAVSYRYQISNTGTFAFITDICNAATAISLIAEDNSSKQTGDEKTFTISFGANPVGAISVCGTTAPVLFTCRLVTASGSPLPNTWIKLNYLCCQSYFTWAVTDSGGYATATMPENSRYLLEVFGTRDCGSPVLSQNFSTTGTGASLGDIVANDITMATASGSVANCNGAGVANGFIIVQKDGKLNRYPLNSDGTFSFTTAVCNSTNTATISIMAQDNATTQPGNVQYVTLKGGDNALGKISTCFVANSSDQEFINYSIDGVKYFMSSATDTFYQYLVPPMIYGGIQGLSKTNPDTRMYFQYYGSPAVGSTDIVLDDLNVYNKFDRSSPPQVLINITEAGAIGQFIAGNFEAYVHPFPVQDTTRYKFVCSFRVKRRE